MTRQWFDVDRTGLGKQAEQHGKGRLVGELIQNALDEADVTRIDVALALVPGRPLADLTVEDDSPEGFRDLAHAYTLFAESYKRTNPEQRGQFNFGEKLVLAVCETATIATTKGTVLFDPEEGRIEKPRQKRERGSVFQGRLRMTARRVSPGMRLPAVAAAAGECGRDLQRRPPSCPVNRSAPSRPAWKRRWRMTRA